MKNLNVLIIILVAFTFSQCKKKQVDFIITGTITDNSVSTPLSGAIVNIYKVDPASGELNLAAGATTNSSGNYSLTINRDQFSSIVVRVSKQHYFIAESQTLFSDLTTEEDNIINISTTAKGWAKVHVVNNSPNASDEIELIKQQGKENCDECCPIAPMTLIGAVDTTYYCVNDANTIYSIYYNVTGSSAVGIKEATTTAFDTTLLEIAY